MTGRHRSVWKEDLNFLGVQGGCLVGTQAAQHIAVAFLQFPCFHLLRVLLFGSEVVALDEQERSLAHQHRSGCDPTTDAHAGEHEAGCLKQIRRAVSHRGEKHATEKASNSSSK